jgi:hypothetical protein
VTKGQLPGWRGKPRAGQSLIQHGGPITLQFTDSTQSAAVAITFPRPFQTAPSVTATAPNYDLIAAIPTRTTTGFTLVLGHPTAAITYTAIGTIWIAAGETA